MSSTPPPGQQPDPTRELPEVPPPPVVDPLWASTTRRGAEPASGPHGADVTAEVPAAPPPAPVTGEDPTTVMPTVSSDATTTMPATGRDATLVMPVVSTDSTTVMPAATPPPGAQYAPEFERSQRRHRRRWWRRAFKLFALVVVAGIAYVGVNFVLVRLTASRDQARPVDVIVVLGAAQYNGRPSPQLQARLDHTVELWDQGLASDVFVTGGNQPGDAYTEAESSRNYLIEHGVPAEAISMEDTGASTWESLSNFAGVAEERGWERVLLVTDPYHSLRSRLIAQELGLTAYTSPTRTSPVQGGDELSREMKEALGISLGRIIGFERLWKLTG